MFPEAAACQMLVPGESKQRLSRGETRSLSNCYTEGNKGSVCVCCVEGDNRVIRMTLGSELSFNLT